MREAIYQALEGNHPRLGRGVAFALNGVILISATSIALETVESLPHWLHQALLGVEAVVLVIFTAEYILRILTSPRPIRYICSFWGLVDLISILPILAVIHGQWAALRTIRLIRLIRLLKILRTSRALDRLQRSLQQVQGDLWVFLVLAAIVVYIAAVGIFILENEAQPDVFGSIPEAAWWAIVSFTTVGYGDAYPITFQGRIFTATMLAIGLGVIAVPTAVITSALIKNSTHDTTEKDDHDPSNQAARCPPLRPRHGRRNHGLRR